MVTRKQIATIEKETDRFAAYIRYAQGFSTATAFHDRTEALSNKMYNESFPFQFWQHEVQSHQMAIFYSLTAAACGIALVFNSDNQAEAIGRENSLDYYRLLVNKSQHIKEGRAHLFKDIPNKLFVNGYDWVLDKLLGNRIDRYTIHRMEEFAGRLERPNQRRRIALDKLRHKVANRYQFLRQFNRPLGRTDLPEVLLKDCAIINRGPCKITYYLGGAVWSPFYYNQQFHIRFLGFEPKQFNRKLDLAHYYWWYPEDPIMTHGGPFNDPGYRP